MTEYTLYCTEEQTRKAFRLGARMDVAGPSPTIFFRLKHPYRFTMDGDNYEGEILTCGIPTAQQVISWLEDVHGIKVCVMPILAVKNDSDENKWFTLVLDEFKNPMCSMTEYKSRDEATMAAIDSALDGLIAMQLSIEPVNE